MILYRHNQYEDFEQLLSIAQYTYNYTENSFIGEIEDGFGGGLVDGLADGSGIDGGGASGSASFNLEPELFPGDLDDWTWEKLFGPGTDRRPEDRRPKHGKFGHGKVCGVTGVCGDTDRPGMKNGDPIFALADGAVIYCLDTYTEENLFVGENTEGWKKKRDYAINRNNEVGFQMLAGDHKYTLFVAHIYPRSCTEPLQKGSIKEGESFVRVGSTGWSTGVHGHIWMIRTGKDKPNDWIGKRWGSEFPACAEVDSSYTEPCMVNVVALLRNNK